LLYFVGVCEQQDCCKSKSTTSRSTCYHDG